MANRRDQKLKLLTLEQIFIEKTDEDHGLTMAEILDELDRRGIETERKSVYTSINALREAGVEVEKRNGTSITYGLARRPFQAQEVVMLVDAVSSSSFLSESAAETLAEKFVSLACEPMRPHIMDRVGTMIRPRSRNAQSIGNIDTLMRAIVAKKLITFQYFYYDIETKPQFCRKGAPYSATPLNLVYTDGVYFLVGYDEDVKDLVNYRVDHMINICITDTPATTNEITKAYEGITAEAAKFNMLRGEIVTASLLVEERAMNNVIDKFGLETAFFPAGDGKARCHVKVINCPAFYGWLLKQGTGVVLEKPARIVDTYRAYLKASLDLYDYIEDAQ